MFIMQVNSPESYISAKNAFKLLRDFYGLNLSDLLKLILDEKVIEIRELHEMLESHGHKLERQSLYRYFNSNPKTNRFPPHDFIKNFSAVLELPDEQAELLCLFWYSWKVYRKYRLIRNIKLLA